MSGRLLKYIEGFKLVTGIRLYFHTKYKSAKGIKVPFLTHPVYLRGIMGDRAMFEHLFLEKEYDIEVPFEPKVIIDLGANVGFASILFASRFPNARIFAIEPDEENFLTAQKNTAPYNNITLTRGAVWYKPELINLVDKGQGEAAYMIEAGPGEHTVRAYTIKEIMSIMNITQIDILKMDIEGSEKEIFEHGAESWVPVTKIIIVETHDRFKKGTSKAIFNMIGKYDFSLEVSGENLVLYNNELVSFPTK